jgi:hypothetical protein
MVKRKFINDSNNRKQNKNLLESIGQDACDVIKLFLELRSRLRFTETSKSQYKVDQDVVILKSLFQTGLFYHRKIRKAPIKNFPQVVETMIKIFCGDDVFINVGSGDRIKRGAHLVSPHYMCIMAEIDKHPAMDDIHFILGSENKTDILQFDFSCTYWKKLCLEWSDMDDIMIDSISATFQGYPLTTQGFSNEDGLSNDDNYLQWNIHNPLFSEADFLQKYPKGCYPKVIE